MSGSVALFSVPGPERPGPFSHPVGGDDAGVLADRGSKNGLIKPNASRAIAGLINSLVFSLAYG
jgi:hypothetical protein